MRTFITNQTVLAQEAKITPQWLSHVIAGHGGSDQLIDVLSRITGIKPSIWLRPRNRNLKRKLKEFFTLEKESAQIFGRPKKKPMLSAAFYPR